MSVTRLMRESPLIYEVNTWVWLERWRRRGGCGPGLDLGSLPEAALDDLLGWDRGLRPDALWLMGVWERSVSARALARTHPEVRAECQRVLPDLTAADIVGSPYAVRRYAVDPALGGDGALSALRARLRQRGVGLLLDLVPNHVACDSPWLVSHPGAFVRGTEAELRAQPGAFFRHPETGEIFAHGRDPYFPPWTDTAQVDAQSPLYRALLVQTMRELAARCDGLRCDMAMLLLHRVFDQTWSGARERRHEGALSTELWPEVITTVRQEAPGLVLLAEVYWDLEAELQSLGFDLTYDKRLYDRLRSGSVGSVRDHLLAAAGYQARSLRFIENHDEPRAATALGVRARAAAVLALTLPGACLIHKGQDQGFMRKLPVQLGRGPDEATDAATAELYARLLPILSEPVLREGTYHALGTRPLYGDDPSHSAILAHAFVLGEVVRVIVVNYSEQPARARVMLPPLPPGRYRFSDALDDRIAPERCTDELRIAGLEVLLAPYGAHLFRVAALPASKAAAAL